MFINQFKRCSKYVPLKPENLMQQDLLEGYHFETKTVLSNLDVSLSTLRRAVSLLREVLGSEFGKGVNDRGYSAKTYYLLQLYFGFINKGASRERAAQYVNQAIKQQTA